MQDIFMAYKFANQMWAIEADALAATREQMEDEVGFYGLEVEVLQEQITALRAQIRELRAGPSHK